jgi:hypothetical protein
MIARLLPHALDAGQKSTVFPLRAAELGIGATERSICDHESKPLFELNVVV